MYQTFNEWVTLREDTLWERHKDLPSIFMRTYYALPTPAQLEEFQRYPDLTAEDVFSGFGYTIVGRGVSSPDNCRKIVESIKMLVQRYPGNDVYKQALTKAQEDAKIKYERWQRGVVFP